ncbi:hypothetical protein F511_12834 [Dorcoceras hygrometricum]|uniref:Uncharacterized protein n=1 Tax=Dorcoceras hygrometricum TaxID=472368 RepID=A0A2Z7C9H1_9LAMI|nr:hypothetical protein F511_12834 [Dorcoceras hygrometricum]
MRGYNYYASNIHRLKGASKKKAVLALMQNNYNHDITRLEGDGGTPENMSKDGA